MATTAQRRLDPEKTRFFGDDRVPHTIPDLTEIQTKSYADFLQHEIPWEKRKDQGMEGVLREIFPIESYDKSLKLEYVGYELGKPRYEPDECRQLRLTYGRPFKVWLRLTKEQPIEEEVYLGDLPIMLGGGEFIINGAERVVVSQLHRSPGVDFVAEVESTERRLHSCRIIPERGSWIELNVTRKESLSVRIDQSGKFSAMMLLRAMDPKYSEDADVLRAFYQTSVESIVDGRSVSKIEGKLAVGDVVYPADSPKAGEVLVECGQKITKNAAEQICTAGFTEVEVMPDQRNRLLLNALADDVTASHEEALLRIYQRLRPGNPPQLEKAKSLFAEKFYDTNRYRLGRVGRFRINRKLRLNVSETEMTLRPDDLIAAMKYLLLLRSDHPEAEVDDIDHLGNRRLRTIDELACDEMRKGFLKLRRTVQERMSLKDVQDMTPRSLVNPKSISAAIEYFFGRGELSQVVDQTNPLSMLTHERRLSALGPGGLNRKRAGFEVRDVHISHYGRICPIETPEGTNIGLISSLAIYASVDNYGFLVTPYRVLRKGKLTDEIEWLRADQEHEAFLAPADARIEKGRLVGDTIIARHHGDFYLVPATSVQYIDVAPSQMVGVSAGLVPFLEHDDANRALMGSNMQRQAVPLVRPDAPVVGTGLEGRAARDSGAVVIARESGDVIKVTAESILVKRTSKKSRDFGVSEIDEYRLVKFKRTNQNTCINQKPIVKVGDKVNQGDVLADGMATEGGDLALGKNVLVAFMPWGGYNFEDAIAVSERLVRDDVFTSIHIEEYEIQVRDTRRGPEEITREIPNVGESSIRNLDERGIIRTGALVESSDVLVGKVTPKGETELSPEERLLRAIFGEKAGDVKDASLKAPPGMNGIVIDTKVFSRKERDEKIRKEDSKRVEQTQERFERRRQMLRRDRDAFIGDLLGGRTVGEIRTADTNRVKVQKNKWTKDVLDGFTFDPSEVVALEEKWTTDDKVNQKVIETIQIAEQMLAEMEEREALEVDKIQRGDELPPGVNQLVKVYVARRRKLAVGDKMAGRHGNKGVVSKVVPLEDMPYLEDGTPVDMILNPLGVPSRMNIGQILETHLGLAAAKLDKHIATPVFAGATIEEIKTMLEEAGEDRSGRTNVWDGRTGALVDHPVTVGQMYMLKLSHLVDDKIHARSIGPYSLVTQQPLGGKAQFGGQRFGEMEVWALEAYGASFTLQEMLTFKSDDVAGRSKIYEAIVKGENPPEPGVPESFNVLVKELNSLGLDVVIHEDNGEGTR